MQPLQLSHLGGGRTPMPSDSQNSGVKEGVGSICILATRNIFASAEIAEVFDGIHSW